MSTNQCIPIKNTLGSSAVVLFACDIIQLFSVVFYVVKAAHKFDFTPVIKKTNKWLPVESGSCSDRDSCFLQGLYVFP